MEHLTQLALGLEVQSSQGGLDLLDTPRSLDVFSEERYAPCANPLMDQFIISNFTTTDSPKRDPMQENLEAGKNTYVYDAHTYHTKVPPAAIVRLIEHYTQPGEIVLDPFCGSGMTGVAALQAHRKPMLIDLSPAATLIAYNFLTPIDGRAYFAAIDRVLATLREEELSLYGTHCRTCGKLVPMEYMVWSYALVCEFCGKEFVLWDVARDEHTDVRESKIRTEFDCPFCATHLQKRKLSRTTLYPVQVGYYCCGSKSQESKAVPDEHDRRTLESIRAAGIPNGLWYPISKLPNGVNTRQAIAHGFGSVDTLYTTRNLQAVARLWDIARRWRDRDLSLKLMFTVTSLYQRVTRLSEFRFWGGSGNIANYNVPMIFNEQNVFKVFHRKARTIRDYLDTWSQPPDMPFCISTQSATDLRQIPDASIDHIFTDPPFGSNINYSEMNYLWEAWLGIFTDTREEAIVNRMQGKTVEDYRGLITNALREMHRVLKPGRWLTLVFHNSSSEIWAAIQAALRASGFELAKIQTLDKRHGTFKQFVSENAVGYDLILHCTKRFHDTAPIHDSKKESTALSAIRLFLASTLKQDPDGFVVRYLHVGRQDELDTRKLYSLWLKKQMEADTIIDLDYHIFRQMAQQAIELDLPNYRALTTE